MHIKAERSQHNNQGIIKLIFDYDREIVKKIRTIPGILQKISPSKMAIRRTNSWATIHGNKLE